MFKDKYHKDNESIKPDEAVVRCLAAKMKAAGSPEEAVQRTHRRRMRSAIAVAACFALIVVTFSTVLILQALPKVPLTTGEVRQNATYDELYAIVKSLEPKFSIGDWLGDLFTFGAKNSSPTTADGADRNEAPTFTDTETVTTGDKDYSGTNVQVADVDEGDILKTDGDYIYILKSSSVVIVRVDGETMTTVSRTELPLQPDKEISRSVIEMYVYKDRLIVLAHEYDGEYSANAGKAIDIPAEYYRYYGGAADTVALIFDIKDRSKPTLMNHLGQSGAYLSSRMVGNKLYLMTNHVLSDEASLNKKTSFVPSVIEGEESRVMDEKDITISANPQNRQYLVVSGFSADKPDEMISTKAVFGSGDTMYSNTKNLLIASYGKVRELEDSEATESDALWNSQSFNATDSTDLIRFSLKNGEVKYESSGWVRGSLINQFAMDEYKGYFRVVTTLSLMTTQSTERGSDSTAFAPSSSGTVNALYTLDQKLQTVGQIEGLAKGERVYSVRFNGEIGYFVTFRQTDPLFTMDLSDPKKPKILSALKIPGFSTYMHPYGQGLLFGFGKDADEQTGQTRELKMSMFDVSDPTDVTEKHVLKLSGSWSEALNNHKAFVISAEKNLIAFPSDMGYEVYSYNKNSGFTKIGDMSSGYYDGYNTIRGLYIEDVFYIITHKTIYAYSLKNFEPLNELTY